MDPTQPIDLRSDTVTKPTPAMRKAIAEAEVGDDVLGDDPTVNCLQEEVANLLGKEAAIFVPSGTMANQIAVRTLCEPGDEIIMHQASHVYLYEGGAPAALSGCLTRLLPRRSRPVHGGAVAAGGSSRQSALRPFASRGAGKHAQPRRWIDLAAGTDRGHSRAGS